jgi:hypothetical protein
MRCRAGRRFIDTAASNSTTTALHPTNSAQPEERVVRGFRRRRHWATVASLIETCKLYDIDPLAYLTDVLTRIINGRPNRDIDQLLPWAFRKQKLKAVA